jgi:DNA-3-methyladenine glycosylase
MAVEELQVPGVAFYRRPAPVLAADLLGLILVRRTAEGLASGRIVEVEAYDGPHDLASHARAGRTRRTATMFGPAGRAYVYLVYGMHSCLNVVAGEEGEAGAVLVRAVAPESGLGLIRDRRGRPADPDARLGAGPARLCQALEIDRRFDGHDLTVPGSLWIASPEPADLHAFRAPGIISGPRIGVDYAGPDWSARPWRFGIRGHPSLSRPFPTEAAR